MKTKPTLVKTLFVSLLIILSLFTKTHAQRIYATTQETGASGLFCLNCIVNDAANASDGNPQTYSRINVAVGIAAQTYQQTVFPASVSAGTPVSLKLGTGDDLLSLQLLGAVFIRPYNGSSPAGPAVAASSLITAVDNNNQIELTITPTQTYDRVRVTLNGGIVGALNTIYLYEAYYKGSGPVQCNTAIDELHGISAGLLNLGLAVGGVANPANAIDGNINTASTLNAGVGLAGAFAQQTILFQSPSVIGDSVQLILSLPQALLDAGVLSNLAVSTYNGNASNNDTQTANSALLRLRLLDLSGGSRKVTITFAPAAIFDRVQLRLGGGIANLLSTLNLFEAKRLIPRPVVSYNGTLTDSLNICTGNSISLTSPTIPNTTVSWYTTATGGTAVFTGNNFVIPALNTSTTYYAEAKRIGCSDASERTKIQINVNPLPAAPVLVRQNIEICSGGTATFSVQSVPGVTINWYVTATGGTPLASGNSFTSGSLSSNTTFYAEATVAGQCVSPTRTAATVTISPASSQPALIQSTVTICEGETATFSLSPVSGEQYRWYSASSGGTLLHTGSTFTTPALSSTTSYFAEAVSSGGCSSTQRVEATAIVNPKPANPVLSASNTSVVAGQSTEVTVTNTQTGVSYNWYTSATGGTSFFTGPTFQTPPLYSATTYYVEAVGSSGCISSARTPITINVTINSNTPCAMANQQSSDVNGICIACGVANDALATDADTTTSSIITVGAGLIGGYAEQELQFQQAGFAGDTVKLVISTPVALADASLLGRIAVRFYNGSTLTGTYPLDNATVKVRLLGGTKYAVYIPASAAYDRVTVRLNSGAATALTSLRIFYAAQQFPVPVFNPSSPDICSGGTATINITSPANGTLNWFNSPTGGTSIFTGANFTTPALTANTTYYVEYSRNSCVSPVRYPVNVTVNDIPASPVAVNSPVTIYSGQTASLVVNSTAGTTVNWYPTSSGGTSLYSGKTLITPALTANTTYYAEASSGSCVSTSRTPVIVNVVPVTNPDVAVDPPSQTINSGESTSFTASSTTPGAIFNWYTTPTGGSSIFTGAVFTTPTLNSNITYYAEATDPLTGAVSTTRASGTVNVNTVTNNDVPCGTAIAQTTEVNALICIGCGVINASASVDLDANTFSRLNVSAGLVNAYAAQTLRFSNTGHTGDSVIVELGIPGSLADVTVLSGVQLATYNGTTYNNDRFTVNGSLLNIRLLGGISRFRVAFPAGADFDRVEIRLNSAVAGVLNSLNVYYASQKVAAPVVTSQNVNACSGSVATLNATVPAHVTVKWYSTATGGTPIFTGSTFNTPPLTTNTTYYAEASRTSDGCAQPVRTPVTITVVPTPGTPVIANSNVNICYGQTATFTANDPGGTTVVNWYDAATGGNLLFTGTSFTTPALTATASYYAEASNGQCAGTDRAKATATVAQEVQNASVSPNPAETCSGSSAVLTATSSQPGVTFKWYNSASGGTPIFTGAQFTTPPLTSSTSYYVETSSGTCTSSARTKADVTVSPTPEKPTISVNPASRQISSGETAGISASSTTPNTTFNWYTSASGGTPIFTGANFITPALTSTTVYYVESTSPSGCVNTDRTFATITVIPVFSTSCDFASSQTIDVNGGLACISCGVSAPDNAVDTDTTNFSTLNIAAGVAGSFVAQQLIFGDNGIAGDSVSVKIRFPVNIVAAGVLDRIRVASYNGSTYNNDGIFLTNSLLKVEILSDNRTALVKFAPSASYDRIEVRINSALVSLFSSLDIFFSSKQVEQPVLSASTVNVCAGGTAIFSVVNSRTGVTYDWFTSPSGGTPIFTGDTFSSPALSATTTYYVQSSRSSNACANPNRVAATVNVTPVPPVPVLAQSDIEICSGNSATLSVTNAGSATVNWYDALTAGNLVFTGNNFLVSPVSSKVYYAELSNGNCVSSARTKATVTVNDRPAMASVQSLSQSICAGATATFTVLNPQSGVAYNWYDASTAGSILFSGPTFTTGPVSQNTSFYIEAVNTSSGCTNSGGRIKVDVTVNSLPGNPSLSATQTDVCTGGTVSISVNNPVSGTQYKWYTTATGNTPVYTGPTFTVSNLTANTSYFVEAVNAGGCSSPSRTQTDITVKPTPDIPVVISSSGSTGVCTGSAATLTISNPQSGYVYRWYDATVNGNLLYTGTEFNTPPLTSVTSYYAEASVPGNCSPSARTSVTININSLPGDVTLTSANVNVCQGSSATFSVSSTQPGITYQWFTDPALTTKVFEGAVFTSGPINATSQFYVSAVNASGCRSANTTTAQATVTTAPGAPVLANGSSVSVCNNGSVTLTIDFPQSGYIYNWYTAATGGTPVHTGATFTLNSINSDISYYVDATSDQGCVSSGRTKVNISVSPMPASPVITANGTSNTSICQGSTITLNAQTNTQNATINWYAQASGGSVVFTGASFTTGEINSDTTFYAEVMSQSGCSSARTMVQVKVVSPPSVPVAAASSVTVCSGSFATLAVSSPQTGITYNWYSDAGRTAKVYTGTTYVTGAVTSDKTFYLEAANGTCVSAGLATVQVKVTMPPASPMVASNSVIVCSGLQTALSILNPQSGYTYKWYSAATGGTPLFTGTTFTTPVITANTTFYAEALAGGGCASSARTAVNVTVLSIPSAPVIANQPNNVCAGSSAVIGVANTAGISVKWYTSPGGGTPVFTGNTFTTPVLTTNTTYFAEAQNSGGCTSASRTAVTVTVKGKLATPVVTVADKTASSITFSWEMIPDATGYQVSMDNGLTFTDPSSGHNSLYHKVTGLTPNKAVSIRVRAIGTLSCQSSQLSAIVNGITENPFGDELYIPNAFSPNGDGKNDVFYVYGNSIKDMRMVIYDQWGEMLFVSSSEKSGWDGNYKGTREPVGVYVYYVTATMEGGKQIKRKGTITLLR